MSKVINRFLNYIKVETTSDPRSGKHPSTSTQLDFARKLAAELQTIGLSDVSVDDKAYVLATLPSNIDQEVPVVGFVAHMDTSPDFSGKGIKPQFVESYNGGRIVLNEAQNIVLEPEVFPELLRYKGQTIITTDGTTLLGADDKAGLSEIVTAMEYLVQHPEIQHGEIRVAFTPDEEIGEGADFFDVAKFGADFAYTLDGGEIGELEYENFNAASAKVKINGRIVHPGFAKNKMKNSMLVAQQFLNMLPANEVPQHTEGFEGFYHLMEISGKVEETNMEFIIRDHNRDLFEQRKALFMSIVSHLSQQYGEGTVILDMKDQYYNMLEKIKPVMYVVDIAKQAMIDCGVKPKIKAIRGGTDGARLSYMGLPCPNVFAGGHNFHGKYEFVPVESMEKAVEVILKIVEKVQDIKK
ncbi:MAG: peptidase T [Prolixibacteraceae bacterium]|nr:peptidase T [Prolixibacteraceae bacterium]MBN2649162.1 peptidase T [Prolixibacteraceae bacterium]